LANRGGKAAAFYFSFPSFQFTEKIDGTSDKICLPPCGSIQLVSQYSPMSPRGFMPYRQAGSQAIVSPIPARRNDCEFHPRYSFTDAHPERRRKVIDDAILFHFAI